jgi:CheY-like chemotaxis protein
LRFYWLRGTLTLTLTLTRRLRVLVIDDAVDTAESLAKVIRLMGHEARFVTSPELAVSTAEDFGPDAVFLDLGMPGIDGYEVARQLRAKFGQAVPRIVAITGHGTDEYRALARGVGFDAYVTKPADLKVVESILAVLFDELGTYVRRK